MRMDGRVDQDGITEGNFENYGWMKKRKSMTGSERDITRWGEDQKRECLKS